MRFITVGDFLGFLILVQVTFSKPLVNDDDGYTVGCVKCHSIDDNRLNIHIVPHSHDDVGWLKTVDQYYYGVNSNIQQATVQYIITTMVDSLMRNPARRYMQVETAFFWKWWQDQSEKTRNEFRYLVENGQLEMVNGAWSMNDEACTNYQSTVDQFTWGLRTLNDTLGACGTPSIGWQIDPFGHSREQVSLFAQLGYTATFFSRLDHDDRTERVATGNMEFAWQGSASIADEIIFANILPNDYGPPSGYCWDIYCGQEPIVDDPDNPNYNLGSLMSAFRNIMSTWATYYSTNNIIVPMGNDFHFTNAEANFINIDRFIRGFKNDTTLNVFYSTPSCYVKAVNSKDPTLKLKTDDFFPYSDSMDKFWAGYFTSRPNSKRFERIGHSILQATKQIYALASLSSNERKYDERLRRLREVMGIMQHHDAITGTEKQSVVSDYHKLLAAGIFAAEESIGEALGDLLYLNSETLLDLSSCLLSNVSICSVSQNSERMIVMVQNPLAWAVSHYVRLPVNDDTFLITGPDGVEQYDVVPVNYDFSFMEISGEASSSYDLVFAARNVPGLGFKLYHIERLEEKYDFSDKIVEGGGDDSITLGWEDQFTIDYSTNLLKSVKMENQTLNLEQNFYYYTSVKSGAYLFAPNVDHPLPMEGEVFNPLIYKGSLVHEFHQKWNDSNRDISQVIRVYKEGGYLEFDWVVGNIARGNEVITKFKITEDFHNDNTFYTDSNGRETIKRVKNFRSDYTYDSSVQPVSSNYYPVTSRISIKDEAKGVEMAILNDRSQGGSSLNAGEIELMVHRRLQYDDGKGVAEALSEIEFGRGMYVRGSHYLLFKRSTALENNKNVPVLSMAAKGRVLVQEKLQQPWIGLASTDKSSEDFDTLQYAPLSQNLPENVNILTFEPWKVEDNSFLLRLEHIFEKDEDTNLSGVQTINLMGLFKNFEITYLQETTLGANVVKDGFDSLENYAWKYRGDVMETVNKVEDESEMKISLTPMQIRTFIVRFGSFKNSLNS